MAALEAIAARNGEPLSEAEAKSLEVALRYFREAAPKHTADEEESLFPTLRSIENQDLQEALAQLQALEQDHRWAEPLHQGIDGIGREYLRNGTLPVYQASQFQEAVHQLADMYRRHIAVEEQQVFPVAARILSSEQKTKIALEMATRRNLGPTELDPVH